MPMSDTTSPTSPAVRTRATEVDLAALAAAIQRRAEDVSQDHLYLMPDLPEDFSLGPCALGVTLSGDAGRDAKLARTLVSVMAQCAVTMRANGFPWMWEEEPTVFATEHGLEARMNLAPLA